MEYSQAQMNSEHPIFEISLTKAAFLVSGKVLNCLNRLLISKMNATVFKIKQQMLQASPTFRKLSFGNNLEPPEIFANSLQCSADKGKSPVREELEDIKLDIEDFACRRWDDSFLEPEAFKQPMFTDNLDMEHQARKQSISHVLDQYIPENGEEGHHSRRGSNAFELEDTMIDCHLRRRSRGDSLSIPHEIQ